MNLNFYFFALLLLSKGIASNDLIHIVKKTLKIKPAYFCIAGLVDTYGFLGYRFPKRQNLVMCPSIKLSCCRPTD